MEQSSPETEPLHSFVQEMNTARVEVIDVEIAPETLKAIADSIATNNLLLLGEIHGVKENPDIIFTIMKRFGIRRLALEWDGRMDEIARRFLANEPIDTNELRNRNDGRVTAGHFGLFKQLTRDGLLDELVSIDLPTPGASWQDRDAVMAKTVLANTSDSPLLVVAGNFHTLLSATTLDDEAVPFHPMGELVSVTYPSVASVTIEYGSGEFYNLEPKEFDTTLAPPVARLWQTDSRHFEWYLPRAHAATVPIDL